MKIPDLERMICESTQPLKFKSSYGVQYDGYYFAIPGDICRRCGRRAVGHYTEPLADDDPDRGPYRTIYLSCIIADDYYEDT